MPVIRSLHLPWLTVEYDRVGGLRDEYAVTKQGAVGVAFTGQTDAVWQLGAGPRIQRTYGPPSVSIASTFRRLLIADEHDELQLEQLGIAAAARISGAHAGLPGPKPGRLRPLDDRLMREVNEYIAAHLRDRFSFTRWRKRRPSVPSISRSVSKPRPALHPTSMSSPAAWIAAWKC